MLTKTDTSGTTQCAWSFENQLTSVTLPGTGGTTNFMYDPFGRRIEKISPTTSISAYDGTNLIETTNGSGSEVADYAQSDGIDEPLAMNRGGTVDYYEQDGLGSITSLTAANGSVAQTYTYDSFGNTTNSTGSVTNFFRYTGREFDTETNLYYYRARYYDPSAGRFLSEDPIGFIGSGTNFYAYVRNSPLNFADPSGLCPPSCGSSGNGVQLSIGAGGGIIAPFAGGSVGVNVGINFDGWNSSLFIQGQANGGFGGGAFAGYGLTANVSNGADPTTGFGTADYIEGDLGVGLGGAGSVANDENGTAYSGGIGLGGRFGPGSRALRLLRHLAQEKSGTS